jgi:hypothetical protein
MRLNRRVDRLLVEDAIADETADFLIDWIQQIRHLGGACSLLSVTVEATIRPCSSTPTWSFFQR